MTDHGTVTGTGEISRMNRSQEETAFAALLERHRREFRRTSSASVSVHSSDICSSIQYMRCQASFSPSAPVSRMAGTRRSISRAKSRSCEMKSETIA